MRVPPRCLLSSFRLWLWVLSILDVFQGRWAGLRAASGTHDWCTWRSPSSLSAVVMACSGSVIQQPVLHAHSTLQIVLTQKSKPPEVDTVFSCPSALSTKCTEVFCKNTDGFALAGLIQSYLSHFPHAPQ